MLGSQLELPEDKTPPSNVKNAISEQVLSCHPELVSGSHNSLILLDAETSSA
jgi:hypothetical protein